MHQEVITNSDLDQILVSLMNKGLIWQAYNEKGEKIFAPTKLGYEVGVGLVKK